MSPEEAYAREALKRTLLAWEHKQGRFTYADRPDVPIPWEGLSPKRMAVLDAFADHILASIVFPPSDVAKERRSIVAYMRHLADLRPADARGLRVIASDVEALFHHDEALNPGATP